MNAGYHDQALKRFWSKVDCSDDPDACWPWLAGRFPQGYGSFSYQDQDVGAHVFSYEQANGPAPPGLHVCRSCDNPRCCNPKHLFAGTNADNMADKMAKGRNARGEMMSNAKPTEDAVRFIRKVYVPGSFQFGRKALAKKFGVSPSLIKQVVAGSSWRHVGKATAFYCS